jgi:predicted small lipoprotein YifL
MPKPARLGYSRDRAGELMTIRTFIILLLAVSAVSGCGRRGPLERPEGPETTLAPEATLAPAEPDSGFSEFLPTPEDPEAPPPPPPQRRFFLDFLL